VAAHQIELQPFDGIVRDAYLAQLAEAGVDSVNRPVFPATRRTTRREASICAMAAGASSSRRFPEAISAISFNVSGCPRSCIILT